MFGEGIKRGAGDQGILAASCQIGHWVVKQVMSVTSLSRETLLSTAALVNTPHPYTTLDASVNFNSFLDLKYIT
jgi:hypothetical protein